MQIPRVESRRRRGGHGNQGHEHNQITAHAMVLVNGFGIIDAAEKLRGVVLRYTDQHLKEKEDVGGETENAMGGCEMGGTVGEFVIFDDDEAGEKGKKASDV